MRRVTPCVRYYWHHTAVISLSIMSITTAAVARFVTGRLFNLHTIALSQTPKGISSSEVEISFYFYFIFELKHNYKIYFLI